MKKISLILLILTCVSCTKEKVRQQEYCTLRGWVRDSITNEPLPGAVIKLSGTNMGAMANVNGWFTIDKVPYGTYTLQANYKNYNDKYNDNLYYLRDIKYFKSRIVIIQSEFETITLSLSKDTINYPMEGIHVVSSSEIRLSRDFYGQKIGYERRTSLGDVGFLLQVLFQNLTEVAEAGIVKA